MNMQKTIPSLLIFLTTISYIGLVSALPASECKGMYDDCMDGWFTSQSTCAGRYMDCRAAPGEE